MSGQSQSTAGERSRVREVFVFEPVLINQQTGNRFRSGFVYVSPPNQPMVLNATDVFTVKDGNAIDADGNPLLLAADIGFGVLHSWTRLTQNALNDATSKLPIRIEVSFGEAAARQVRLQCRCFDEVVTTIVYKPSKKHPTRPVPPPVPVMRGIGGQFLSYRAALKVDADGAPNAYHDTIEKLGLDDWANAVGCVKDAAGNYVTHEIKPNGFFRVSPTSLRIRGFKGTDPQHYVDATKIPYIALPPEVWNGGFGVRFGDYATVFWEQSQKLVHAVLAEGGPPNKIGEGSVALAAALGTNASARSGGVSARELIFIVYPGSGKADARHEVAVSDISIETINHEAGALFDNWGGMDRLHCCFMPSGPTVTELHDDWA